MHYIMYGNHQCKVKTVKKNNLQRSAPNKMIFAYNKRETNRLISYETTEYSNKNKSLNCKRKKTKMRRDMCRYENSKYFRDRVVVFDTHKRGQSKWERQDLFFIKIHLFLDSDEMTGASRLKKLPNEPSRLN